VLLAILIDPGPIALLDQILDARRPVAAVMELAVDVEQRVALGLERRRGGEDAESLGDSPGRRPSLLLARPAPVLDVAAGEDLLPPEGLDDVGQFGASIEIVAGGGPP
jgi:hypothetical protein